MHKKQVAAPKCNHSVRPTLSPQILTPFFFCKLFQQTESTEAAD